VKAEACNASVVRDVWIGIVLIGEYRHSLDACRWGGFGVCTRLAGVCPAPDPGNHAPAPSLDASLHSMYASDQLPQLSRLRELRTPRVGCLFDLDRGEDILWCVDCHQLERPRAIKLAQTCANLHAILQPDEKAGVGSPAHGRAARP
jgi:hypothetical protein